jgi:hypothetical protein
VAPTTAAVEGVEPAMHPGPNPWVDIVGKQIHALTNDGDVQHSRLDQRFDERLVLVPVRSEFRYCEVVRLQEMRGGGAR